MRTGFPSRRKQLALKDTRELFPSVFCGLNSEARDLFRLQPQTLTAKPWPFSSLSPSPASRAMCALSSLRGVSQATLCPTHKTAELPQICWETLAFQMCDGRAAQGPIPSSLPFSDDGGAQTSPPCVASLMSDGIHPEDPQGCITCSFVGPQNTSIKLWAVFGSHFIK